MMQRQAVQWAIGVRNPAGWVHQEEGRGRTRFEARMSRAFTELKEDEELVVRRWSLPWHRRHAEELPTRRVT